VPQTIAHPTDIFSLAVTPTQIISASGASSIKVYDTTQPESPLVQTIEAAHKLGCHHLVTSRNGRKAASVGFGGEAKIWRFSDEDGDFGWKEEGRIVGATGVPLVVSMGKGYCSARASS
jgi:superkiller protein 8